jgi:hypothetical protein
VCVCVCGCGGVWFLGIPSFLCLNFCKKLRVGSWGFSMVSKHESGETWHTFSQLDGCVSYH